MPSLLQDLRYALRRMRRSPGFTLATVLTLGLGMGANTAMFSLVEAVLLRPLPYPESERLVRLWAVNAQEGEDHANLNPLDMADYRRRARSFADLAGISLRSFAVTGGTGEPERVRGALVGSGFLPALGTRAVLGRTLLPADKRPGAPTVAVLGHALWERRFHADPGVLGMPIVLDDKPAMIVGVLPPGFRAPAADREADPPEVFGALQIREGMGRGGHWLATIGRLAPGVSLRRAQAEMDALAAGIAREHPTVHPATGAGWGVRLQDLREATAGEARAPLLLLSAGVALVLLIACVNVASLLLVRAAGRRHEIAVRTALGAGLPRLVRQLVTESVALAALGGAASLVLAWACLALLPRLAPGALPRQEEIGTGILSLPVLAFAGAVSLVAGLLFGLVPAWHAADPRISRGLGGRSGGRFLGRRLPAALVVGEIALALVLLVGAGLLLASFGRLLAVDPGFRPAGLLTLSLELPAARAAEPARVSTFFQELCERAAALPGVDGATAVDFLPFGGGYSCNSFEAPEGVDPARAAAIPCAEYRTVVPAISGLWGSRSARGAIFAWRTRRAVRRSRSSTRRWRAGCGLAAARWGAGSLWTSSGRCRTPSSAWHGTSTTSGSRHRPRRRSM